MKTDFKAIEQEAKKMASDHMGEYNPNEAWYGIAKAVLITVLVMACIAFVVAATYAIYYNRLILP